MKSIEQKIKSILNRRSPRREKMNRVNFSTNEHQCLNSGDLIECYVRLAMLEVDDAYTRSIKRAGEYVKTCLERLLPIASFHYQGSILTNTHIRGDSDIDLLVLCEKFFSCNTEEIRKALRSPRPDFSHGGTSRLKEILNLHPYSGNPTQDLTDLRKECESLLVQKNMICDTSQGKSVRIINRNLDADVDVVIASWYDDVKSIVHERETEYRGICVFDNTSPFRIGKVDYPFLQACSLNARSAETEGRLKRMIRLLKTLKAEAQKEIDFSSFDIYSLCYAMPIECYHNLDYLHLIPALTKFFEYTLIPAHRENLYSVDGREKIFNTTSKVKGAISLFTELLELNARLKERGMI